MVNVGQALLQTLPSTDMVSPVPAGKVLAKAGQTLCTNLTEKVCIVDGICVLIDSYIS